MKKKDLAKIVAQKMQKIRPDLDVERTARVLLKMTTRELEILVKKN